MKTFRFPLQRVLEWRGLQMRTEEEKLAGLLRRLDTLSQKINALTASELKSESEVLKLSSVTGSDLQALTAFRARVKKERDALEIERAQCAKQIALQRTRLLKARKDFRILEKLKDRQKKAWVILSDRELESVAADAHFSKLVHSGSEP